MPEEAKISFYSIERCGYYQQGATTPEFGDIGSILSQLQTWVSQENFSLEETCTYDVGDAEDLLRTFCFDIINNGVTGDYLLTTWNETPSNHGRIAAVSAGNRVGEATVHLNTIPPDTIPGYGTYFWFIPSHDIFATIRFQHTVNGHRNLVRYFNSFLEQHTDHTVMYEDENGDIEIEGYQLSANDDIQELRPSFVSRPLRQSGEIDLLRRKRNKIRKVVRKSILDLGDGENLSLWQRMLDHLGVGENNPDREEVRVEYSFPLTPTQEEFNNIIETWEESGMSWWNDVGFKFESENQIRWLSNALVKHTLAIDVQRDNDETVNTDSLFENLTTNRTMLINLVQTAMARPR